MRWISVVALLMAVGCGTAGHLPDGGPDSDSWAVFEGVAAHRSWLQLPGSAVMKKTNLVTLVASNDADSANLFLFSDTLVVSGWWSTLADAYGLDPVPTSVHLVGPPIVTDMSRSEQIAYITATIADAGGVEPNGSRLYLLYLPASIAFSDSSSCGHHGRYPTTTTSIGDEYAVVRQCHYNAESGFEDATIGASHEIAEAATDVDSSGSGYHLPLPPAPPWVGMVWQVIQPPRIENGDLCEGTRISAGLSPAFLYQRIWSNAAAATGGDPCIPSVPNPYFNLTIDQDWYAARPGKTVTIPFTGWSTAARPNWWVNPHQVNGSMLLAASDYRVRTELPPSGCNAVTARLNNGATGTFEIDLPSSAASGDWAVFSLHNIGEVSETAGCFPPVGTDAYHFWPVGIYVP